MLKTTLAGLLARRVRLLLTSVAIVLGVGFVAGTLVLTDSIDRGIGATFARSAGKVDAAVLPPKGTDGGIPAALVARLRAVPGVTAVHGLVRGDAALVGRDGKAVGVQATAGMSVPAGRLLRYGFDAGRPPAGPGEAVLDGPTADREHFRVGDAVTVLDSRQRPHRFTLVGVLDPGLDPDAAARGAVGFDPATAAAMTGTRTVAEIDVAGAAPAAVAAAAGPSYRVLSGRDLGAEQARAAGADVRVFTAGLLLFALVALLVSALVIYNTFAILIAQRVREMALLRCVGATRRQVFGGVVAEAAAVGLAGSLLGLAAGLGLGAGALALLRASGADLPDGGAALTPRTVAVGLAAGITVTVVSALLPARAATRVAPVSALRSGTEPAGPFRLGRVRSAVAALLLLGGGALAGYGATGMAKGPAAMYTVAAGGAVAFLAVIAAMPALVRPLARAVGAVPARLGGVPARLAVGNAQRTPRRTATTTMALTVGVGLVTLFAVVAAGGKATSDARLARSFPVDFMLSPQYGGASADATVPGGLDARLRALPELAAVAGVREQEVRVDGRKSRARNITGGALGTLVKPVFTSGSLAAFGPGTAVVDERTAAGLHLRTGGTVRAAAGARTVTLRVAGVFRNDLPIGGLLVPADAFDRLAPGRGAAALYAKVRDGASAAAAHRAVEAAARPYPTVKVVSQAELREQLTRAIDTLLAVFAGLLGLAIVIALFGIANTLTLSVVERTRESALLRALGVTKRQLRRMLSVEALVMAVIGAVTGVVLGAAFGWAGTKAMTPGAVVAVPYGQIAAFVALAGAAGMLAAVLPARRAARVPLAAALSED
ncbi:ABC transporter permease [Actinomadura parmotrematis]|uniref:ABC transporter permease n=1 Tax=Actinomadura parmotrematis TaxID=2864039 RepID=A0ABS7FZA2_9ACTN|nr:ABC transporter permease [Actinomadura parmotrematis]MBW8484974.1 ABC transporter permease [Actinomadura parmotrematis]